MTYTILDWQRVYFQCGDPDLWVTWPSMAVLMTHANKDLICRPSQARIARFAGFANPDTVRKHLKLNQDKGWLTLVKPGGPGRGANHYRFNIPDAYLSHLHGGDIASPQRGPIPSTGRGHIPSTGMAKLSRRTVHRTVHRTVQGSHPQGWEPKTPDAETSGEGLFPGHPKEDCPALSHPQGGDMWSGLPDPVMETAPDPFAVSTAPTPSSESGEFDPFA